jgi:hypothetical protein
MLSLEYWRFFSNNCFVWKCAKRQKGYRKERKKKNPQIINGKSWKGKVREKVILDAVVIGANVLKR